jgi:hypothetical protein
LVGFNPAHVIIGSGKSTMIEGSNMRKLLSRLAGVQDEMLQVVCDYLKHTAKALCKSAAAETPLPLLRDINHDILLIDENKVIPFRCSWCPKNFMDQWRDKLDIYQKTGRWEVTTWQNVVPMLFIPKPAKDTNGKAWLQTVFNL